MNTENLNNFQQIKFGSQAWIVFFLRKLSEIADKNLDLRNFFGFRNELFEFSSDLNQRSLVFPHIALMEYSQERICKDTILTLKRIKLNFSENFAQFNNNLFERNGLHYKRTNERTNQRASKRIFPKNVWT
jgi:hypothetical protein